MNKDFQIAKKTIQSGIVALKKLSSSFNRTSQFSKAVNLCNKANKIGVIGVGKSYILSLKVAGTMASLNQRAVGFSANDLIHGGLGFFSKNDILLIFSVSGQSAELDPILKYANKFKIKTIGVSCKANSILLKHSTIKILLPKVSEAGSLLAPTSSSTMFTCFGDALSIALVKRKKWTNKILKANHPAGSIGRQLIRVSEVCAKGKEIPLVSAKKSVKAAIKEMTKKKLGMVCCKEKNGRISILTDGDLRRHSNNLYKKSILNISSKKPTWISHNATALSAVEIMNTKKITQILVAHDRDINKKIKTLLGVLHLHHCLGIGIK